MSDYVLTQDISSGRVHKRLRAESGYMSHEADNLDLAGSYRVLSETEAAAVPITDFCLRCWPPGTIVMDGAVTRLPDDDASTHDESEPA